MVALCHVEPDWVRYPAADTGRHELNSKLFRDSGMNDVAISLVERMPQMDGGHEDVEWCMDSVPTNYFDGSQLGYHRLLHSPYSNWTYERNPSPSDKDFFLGPFEVALSLTHVAGCRMIIIDTEASK
jgi:hypothetical protein